MKPATKSMEPGHDVVARAEMGERVAECWDTLRRIPDRERSILRKRGQTWPGMVYDAAEHAAWEGVKIRRPPPSAAQVSRMYEVLEWLLALAKQERGFFKAVWLCCAEKRDVTKVGKIMGIHRETVRIWRDNGLDRMANNISQRKAA